MNRIHFMSRYEAEGLYVNPRGAIISITDPGSQPARLDGHIQILRLTFYDLDKPVERFTEVFTEEHAEQILDFVSGVRDQIDTLVVHCEAGISRSCAVAAALTRLFLGDDNPVIRRGMPNMRVYRGILTVAERRGIAPVWNGTHNTVVTRPSEGVGKDS